MNAGTFMMTAPYCPWCISINQYTSTCAVVDSNLLLPVGVPLQRQRAQYAVTIYCAEDLPRTDVGIVATVQKAITGKDVAFIDACVRVSFVGHIVSLTACTACRTETRLLT